MRWYLYRLKTMSIVEILYRILQQILYKLNKLNAGKKFQKNNSFGFNKKVFNPSLLQENLPTTLQVFEKKFDYSGEVNWHLDLSTNKEFPLIYSFEIDIRTPKYGSAKYVWEVNRMLFLPRIAINYSNTKDTKELSLFIELISDWNRNNPYLLGVNWYSNIEVNIRLINWAICWEILDGNNLVKSNDEFKIFVDDVWLPLIYSHCKYSSSFPSYFSSANNHLISEYAGLFISNCVWKFPESKQWMQKSKAGLEREIILQHTTEGVNREEAAEYIQFITDFFLLAYLFGERSGNSFSPVYRKSLENIFDYILNFLDCQGNFPQYGDEDDGRLLSLDSCLHSNNFDSILISASIITKDDKYKHSRLKLDNKNLILFGEKGKSIFDSLTPTKLKESSFYPQSGHFIFRNSQGANEECYLHFDVAPLGYLSIAAHGHADALSVIMHVDGKKVLIDSGTYTYHTDIDWRYYFIGTKAHNTVCINGHDQALKAGALLWLEHFVSSVIDKGIQGNYEWVEGKHNGYKKYGFEHKRKIEFNREKNIFQITDTIVKLKNSDSSISIQIPWHFHPDCILDLIDNTCTVRLEGIRSIRFTFDHKLKSTKHFGEVDEILGWYSPSFYKKSKTNTILNSVQIDNITDEISFLTTIEIIEL